MNTPTPQAQLDAAIEAVAALRTARDLLKIAGAPRALERVRLALNSAEGAVRHAEMRVSRAGAARTAAAVPVNALSAPLARIFAASRAVIHPPAGFPEWIAQLKSDAGDSIPDDVWLGPELTTLHFAELVQLTHLELLALPDYRGTETEIQVAILIALLCTAGGLDVDGPEHHQTCAEEFCMINLAKIGEALEGYELDARFEVLTQIGDGADPEDWENVWRLDEKPHYFPTRDAALAEITDHIQCSVEAVERGDMEEAIPPSSLCIRDRITGRVFIIYWNGHGLRAGSGRITLATPAAQTIAWSAWGAGAATTLDEDSLAHITKHVTEGYREGELNVSARGRTFRGWWCLETP